MLRWRLIYADGSILDEPEEGGTILESWPDALELHLIEKDKAVCRVPLEGWRPIFYRERSVVANPGSTNSSLSLGSGIFGFSDNDGQRLASRLDATVFGRGRDADVVETQIWACVDGKIIDCPQRFISIGAIRHLIETQSPAVV